MTAGLILSLVTCLSAAVSAQAKSDQAQSDTAAAKLAQPNQQKLVYVDVKVDGETRRLSRRYVAYSLGKELALGMNLRLRGIDNEAAASTKKWTSIYAAGLQLKVGEPPNVTGMRDAFKVKAYLLDAEDSVRAAIAAQHSAGCANLFQVATMSTFAPLLYFPGTDAKPASEIQQNINTMILNSLKMGASNSEFASSQAAVEATQPLVEWMESGKPGAPAISAPASQVLGNVTKLLKDEMADATKNNRVIMLSELETDPTEKTTAEPAVEPAAGANKAALIAALRNLFRELQAEDYEAARKFVVMPPRFSSDELVGFDREFSAAGIDVLERDAKFVTAVAAFGEKRAERLAKKMGATLSNCFAFNHQVGDEFAEVIAEWDGESFKIVRADDIVKIATEGATSDSPAAAEKMPAAENAARVAAAKPASLAGLLPRTPNASLAELAGQYSALAAAAASNPEDADQLAKFGLALAGMKSYPNAWLQVTAARKLDPDNRNVVAGIDAVMDGFLRMGIFTVGVPTETIDALLGKPDETIDTAIGKRLVYAHWAIDMQDGRVYRLIDLRGATEASFETRELITTELDGRTWAAGIRKIGDAANGVMMFVPGEMVSNQTERVDIDRLLDGGNLGSIQQIADRLAAAEKQRVAGATYTVLQQDDQSIIIASMWPAGGGRSLDEHRLVRLFKGDKDLHRLVYAIRSADPPSAETQKKWLEIFQNATLVDGSE